MSRTRTSPFARTSIARYLAGPALAACCLVTAAHADHDAATDVLQDDWRWVQFTREDGLPSMQVQFVAEAADGTVWVGTDNGLARYDGWEWHRVAPPNGRAVGPLRAMATAADGRVWLAGEQSLFRTTGDGLEHVTLPHRASSPLDVAAVEDGAVYALTILGTTVAICRVDQSPGVVIPFDASEGGDLHQLVGGTALRALTTKGQFTLRDGKWSADSLTDERRAIVAAAEERATGHGLAAVSRPLEMSGIWTWEAGSAPERDPRTAVGVPVATAISPDGVIIVAYDTADVLVRRRGEWKELRPRPPPLSVVRDMTFTQSGDLWVATSRGVWFHRRSLERWTRWRHEITESPRNRVHDVAMGHDRALWFATAAGVEGRRPDGSLVTLPALPERTRAVVTSLAVQPDGSLLAGSGGDFTGLRHWDGERWRAIEFDTNGRPLGLIEHLHRDRQGRLFALSLARTLEAAQECDGDVHTIEHGRARRWEHADELAGRRIYDMVDEADGTIWFATTTGLARLKDDVWTHLTIEDGLRFSTVFCIEEARQGGIWFGHRGEGLGRVLPGGSITYAVNGPGPASELIWSLQNDARGRLWVGTSAGLSCYADGVWTQFDERAGLATPQLWPVLPLEDRVVVGTRGGGTWVLHLDEEDSPPPRVRLATSLTVGESSYVRWSAHPYRGEQRPADVETRHRVAGGAWSGWSVKREAHIQWDSSGPHRVEVQAKSLFGRLSSPEGADISVPLPLHKQTPFKAGVAVCAGLLAIMGALVTARRRRDAQALRASEARYRRVVDEASDGILLTDPTTRILEANPCAAALLGTTPESLVDRLATDLIAPEDRNVCPPRLADILRGDVVIQERRLRRADGTLAAAELSSKLIGDGRIQIVVRDLTERRRLEAERLGFERKLAETQKLESLGVLAGGVAHDFNNVLTAILGNAEVALGRVGLGHPAARSVSRIRVAAQRASDLTQQLMAYAGGDSVEREPLDLNDLIAEMGGLLEASVGKGVTLRLDLDPTLPAIKADAGRIRQVVMNLIVNASEAIGARTGTIHLRTDVAAGDDVLATPAGKTAPRAGWVRLRVEDSGDGIDEETRKRIFEPFFTTKFAGRGLGLAAVRGIAQTHGGAIEVESTPKQGTTFTLLLPGTSQRPKSRTEESSEFELLDRGTVLVVDDEAEVLEVLVDMLQTLGFDVVSASSGEAALHEMQRHAADVTCAVLDHTMPGMSGAELTEQLRARHPELPILMVSGWREESTATDDASSRPDEFLQKPFTQDKLGETLERVLRQRSRLDRRLRNR